MIIFKQGKLIINKYTFKLTSNYKKSIFSYVTFIEKQICAIINQIMFYLERTFTNLIYDLET